MKPTSHPCTGAPSIAAQQDVTLARWTALMEKDVADGFLDVSTTLFELAAQKDVQTMTGPQALIAAATAMRENWRQAMAVAPAGNLWLELGKLVSQSPDGSVATAPVVAGLLARCSPYAPVRYRDGRALP